MEVCFRYTYEEFCDLFKIDCDGDFETVDSYGRNWWYIPTATVMHYEYDTFEANPIPYSEFIRVFIDWHNNGEAEWYDAPLHLFCSPEEKESILKEQSWWRELSGGRICI